MRSFTQPTTTKMLLSSHVSSEQKGNVTRRNWSKSTLLRNSTTHNSSNLSPVSAYRLTYGGSQALIRRGQDDGRPEGRQEDNRTGSWTQDNLEIEGVQDKKNQKIVKQ